MLSHSTRRVLRLLTPEKVNRYSRVSFSSKSDSGSVGDYFSSLRWKAADALTSNLPEEERNVLLDKLAKNGTAVVADSIDDESDDEDDNPATSYEPSIDEAIAAAKLQEAERYEQKWERDKEELIAEAEMAARARIESDIEIQKRQIAFEEWKAQLEKEKEQKEETSEIGDHPVLGPIVADLGYKRIHLASASNLATIPIWKKQRIYRHERSKNMANEKMKTLSLGLPGVIGIFEKTDGGLNIIDGQHRIGMLKMLGKKVPEDGFDFENVLVEVYPAQEETNQDSQVQDIFVEVNKAEPVKLVDMPGVAKAKDRKIITEVAESLRQKYPDMFSESQRCRSPHLNIDNLRDALFASKIIDKHSLKTSKAMEDWIMKRNDMLESEFQEEENQKFVNANALKKANRFKFYLGLESSWLYK
eukprot:CAMPEP_0116128526 /NCGR_PEP_ID=MMETSP0329-20121206/7406_1 /TAXON_ID=697910 /ORGANISM="Pseudo-nitzschia arenysensis, Strain B593" /LENGTH=416 /DNA_ID=CAMNT_0003622669 /DNA_START=5 /DNA_END=1255 /DNA_ORIENTATION=-